MTEEPMLEAGAPEFEATGGLPPKKLSEIRQELNLSHPIVVPADLVDKTFTILKAKPWESSLGKGGTVYYCTCAWPETGEVFDTNLGGGAVVEELAQLFAAGVATGIEVTLRQKTGGKYGRYYVLE